MLLLLLKGAYVFSLLLQSFKALKPIKTRARRALPAAPVAGGTPVLSSAEKGRRRRCKSALVSWTIWVRSPFPLPLARSVEGCRVGRS